MSNNMYAPSLNAKTLTQSIDEDPSMEVRTTGGGGVLRPAPRDVWSMRMRRLASCDLTPTIYYILDPLHPSIVDLRRSSLLHGLRSALSRKWFGSCTGGGDWQNHGFCVPRSPVHATKRLKRAGMVVRNG